MFVSAAFAWLLAGLREALTQPEHGVKCFFLMPAEIRAETSELLVHS